MSRELGKENDVKLKKYMMFAITVFLLCSALVAPALAIEESEVESAIAASSREEVAGNIFIWFLRDTSNVTRKNSYIMRSYNSTLRR